MRIETLGEQPDERHAAVREHFANGSFHLLSIVVDPEFAEHGRNRVRHFDLMTFIGFGPNQPMANTNLNNHEQRRPAYSEHPLTTLYLDIVQ